MTIVIHSTEKIVSLNGVAARIWEGKTDSGIPVHCYVTRIAVADDEDTTQFERELQQHCPPSPAIDAIPLSMIL